MPQPLITQLVPSMDIQGTLATTYVRVESYLWIPQVNHWTLAVGVATKNKGFLFLGPDGKYHHIADDGLPFLGRFYDHESVVRYGWLHSETVLPPMEAYVLPKTAQRTTEFLKEIGSGD